MSKELPSLYQAFIHLSRYSRWLEEEGRRETWEETVSRYFDFFVNHLKEQCNYVVPDSLRNELQDAVLNLEIMPSMRALMTAGDFIYSHVRNWCWFFRRKRTHQNPADDSRGVRRQ